MKAPPCSFGPKRTTMVFVNKSIEKIPCSVVLIARNEAGHIARAVASAAEFAETVVVDGGSTDNTVAIAEAAGARVVKRPWTNFSDQRNYSLAQAQHDWVLVLDADEAITPALTGWVREFFAAGRDKAAPWGYKIRRAEYFIGKRILGACWNPSFQDRFFLRAKASYVGEIHEYPLVEGGMVNAPEEMLIEHNPNITAESFFDKMNRYTTIEAFDRYRAGQRTSLPHLGVVFFATWWKNYFYYKGYRDGAHGFVICLMEAVSRTVRHIKLWQIQEMHRLGKAEHLPDPRRALEGSQSRAMESKAASRP
ncbi:MAG: glycosyltransferase family 2 protein [Proteobacteria bacterium]|nr:MAG: glycosyltransferase family 2 protein [Pseudomonadota bacterium]